MESTKKILLKLVLYYFLFLLTILVGLLLLNRFKFNSNYLSSVGFVLLLVEVLFFILVIYEISRESSSLIVNSYNERYTKRRLNESANLAIGEFQQNEVHLIVLLLILNTLSLLAVFIISW